MAVEKEKNMRKVTRGHNIVADRWAGASNPHPHPNLPPTLKHTQKVFQNARFPTFRLVLTDGPTDGWTDGPLDGQSHLELRVRN